MVMMFGGCKTNTIMLLLTRSMPFSPNMQVMFANGHCKATFASIKLLFLLMCTDLQRRISLSIVAHIMELTMVV
jgi:hypothetical protein